MRFVRDAWKIARLLTIRRMLFARPAEMMILAPSRELLVIGLMLSILILAGRFRDQYGKA